MKAKTASPTTFAAALMRALLALMFVSVAARAHDADFALTSMEWNDQAGALEVIHRLHTHHAFDAAAIEQRGGGDFAGTESLAALGLYVEKRFAIADGDDAPIKLDFVGAKIEGDYVFVYQEAPLETAPTELRVRNDILVDLRPSQVNQVNVRLNSVNRTLVFDDNRRGKHQVVGGQ